MAMIPIFNYTFDKIKKIFSQSAEDLDEEKKEAEANKGKVSPEDFDIIALLGKGSFGEVFLVKEKKTGTKFAMKLLQKEKIVSKLLPIHNP